MLLFNRSFINRYSFLFAIVLLVGCGPGVESAKTSMNSSYSSHEPADSFSEESMTGSSQGANSFTEQGDVGFSQGQAPTESASQSSVKSETKNRKIIYRCTLGLVVADYKAFESRIPSLVDNYGGFIANNETDRRYQTNQSGTWVIRIPVTHYSDFLSGIDSFGFVESREENAQDVTEEFVDTEARIKTKRQLETRILKMLDERNGKLTDVLQIERELARVREEIERMEGRVRFLTDRASLATVTISCREEQSYQPATAPTLAARIKQAWSNSLNAMKQIGENALVATIAIAPWLFVLGLFGFLFYFVAKRSVFRRHSA